ncbi:MAG: MBL fold metallo-hydrolase [Oscillospiraceae bacterium]|nr:MBL fold metallo-hydrolase [Oscillospiraceae bacterium]
MKVSGESIVNCSLHESQIGVWYLGQEGFLFKNGDKHLVVDPYLSDYVDKNCCRFVKWERLYEPPVSAEEISFVDVVLCTHTHYDHADPETLPIIAKNNPNTKFVVPAPEAEVLVGYGISRENIIPACDGEMISVEGFDIVPVPSAHEELHVDENGNYHELGYIIIANGKKFFHAGDMCIYDGLIELLRGYDIDIAFLPINGRDYFRNKNDIIGNFNCEEAVLLAKEIGAKMLVPMHHDLYAVNRVNICNFVNAINELDAYRKYHVFAPGEMYVSM